MVPIKQKSTLTCIYCSEKTSLDMPSDSCLISFECPHCHHILRPKSGDCCVFCSYGDNPCPPIQMENFLRKSHI